MYYYQQQLSDSAQKKLFEQSLHKVTPRENKLRDMRDVFPSARQRL